jgi:hypothetical protein
VARFLATLPVNLGFFNLGTVQAYPTGGSGPTAYGATSYYGSDPLPPRLGDSVNNPVNLGTFQTVHQIITITNTHGGLSRQQSSFYTFKLIKPLSIKLTQNFSQQATTRETNRNTLVSFYKIESGNFRRELPINDMGYVVEEASVSEGDDEGLIPVDDYPITDLSPGDYVFLITNDIRYLETTYSISLEAFINDWRFVYETVDTSLDFGLLTESVTEFLDFGSVTV